MKTPRGYLTHPKRHSSVMTPLPRASKRLKQKSSPDSEASFLSSPAAKVPMPTSHKSYTCSSCPQIFKEKSHLEEHRKALHPPAATHTSIASEPTPPGPQSIALPGLSRVNNSPGPPRPPRVNGGNPPPILNTPNDNPVQLYIALYNICHCTVLCQSLRSVRLSSSPQAAAAETVNLASRGQGGGLLQ